MGVHISVSAPPLVIQAAIIFHFEHCSRCPPFFLTPSDSLLLVTAVRVSVQSTHPDREGLTALSGKTRPFSRPMGPAWFCPRLPQLFELQHRSLLISAKGICTCCSLCLECCFFLLLSLISSWLSCGPQLNHFFLKKAFHLTTRQSSTMTHFYSSTSLIP